MKTVLALTFTLLGIWPVMSYAESAAENAAEDIVRAAIKGDASEFRQCLIGSTVQQYGTQAVMDSIRARAEGYKKVDAEDERLVSAAYGNRRYMVDVYAEKPLDKKSALPKQAWVASVELSCSVYTTYYAPECPYWGIGWDRGYWYNGFYCYPGFTTESEYCAVQSIR